jgi:hypothetical protein
MNDLFTILMVIIFGTMIIDCIVLIIINRSESPYKLKLWHIIA